MATSDDETKPITAPRPAAPKAAASSPDPAAKPAAPKAVGFSAVHCCTSRSEFTLARDLAVTAEQLRAGGRFLLQPSRDLQRHELDAPQTIELKRQGQTVAVNGVLVTQGDHVALLVSAPRR